MKKIDMNLQHFADPEGAPAGDLGQNDNTNPKNDEQGTGDSGNEGSGNGSSFSREELAKIVSSQTAKALDDFKATELPDLLKSKYEEGKQEANLTAEELAQKKIDDMQAELDRRDADLKKRESMSATESALTEAQLPTSFAKYLVAGTPEDRANNIAEFGKVFHEAVHQGVLLKTAGRNEPGGGSSAGGNSGDDGSYGKRLAETLAKQGENKASHSYFNS